VRPFYFFKKALDAMVRGPFVTLVAVGTIFVAVFVAGLFASALAGGTRLLERWGGEVTVSVYLAADADLEQAVAKARALAPGLEVEGVDEDQALERLKASLGADARILEGVKSDVLPASVELKARGLGGADLRALAAKLGAIDGADQVDFGGEWLDRLERVVGLLRKLGLALFAVFALATAVLVSNTLRLAVYARRDEIEIMKLVGATSAFVELPFLIEGLLQGLLGSGLAALALLGLYALFAGRLAELATFAGALSRQDVLPGLLLGGLVAVGGLLGLAAAAMSVGRFLRRV
jgi:cell division transport system permease protein